MAGRDKKQPLKAREAATDGQREANVGLYTASSVEDLRFVIERQNDQILKQNEEIKTLKKKIDDNDKVVSDFKSELSEVRKKWQSMGDLRAPPSNNTSHYGNDESTQTKIESLVVAYNDIQDRLYEIDKSWKNNLIFYGIPTESNLEDEDPYATEEKVRELIKRKLRITREIPFNRVTRVVHGPEFRGHKPIQVHFANYNDKEDVLRKAKLLKGAGVHISEDFSRKVREHRQELNKFMKEIRARDPARRMFLRYDKLYMGNDVFFYNDKSGRVERLPYSLDTNNSYNSSLVDSVFTSDAQMAHDWGRRPRSKYSSRSRPITPVQALSRQNSMSMDDISQDEFYGTPKPTPMRSRPVTGRSRDRIMAKSVSVESLQYESVQQNGSPTKARYHHPEDIRKISERYLTSPKKQAEFYTKSNSVSGPSRYTVPPKQREVESDDTDRTSPDETRHNKTPEPTFEDEPRYEHPEPPETPKKLSAQTPAKSDCNPLLKLAVPRSARSARERKISFKDERVGDEKAGDKRETSDFSDDEDEQDEVLSLEVESKTLSQEMKESHAIVNCKSSNFCTELVPVLPAISKTAVSSTELVPVESVEIKPLTMSKYPPHWSTSVSRASVPAYSQSGFAPRGQTSTSSLRQVRDTRQTIQTGGQAGQAGPGGVLKLNVAIAGEFSMGSFGNNQQQ